MKRLWSSEKLYLNGYSRCLMLFKWLRRTRYIVANFSHQRVGTNDSILRAYIIRFDGTKDMESFMKKLSRITESFFFLLIFESIYND